LTSLEVECVDAVEGSTGEVGDALVEAVIGGELGLLVDQGLAFVFQAATAVVEFGGSALHLGGVDDTRLVEVG